MKRYIKAAEGLSLEDKQYLAITSTDPKELAQLANDEDVYVRRGVADNLDTPADVLAQLAHDTDSVVRNIAKDNPNCPVKSKKSNKWPSADAWYNIESDEEFENMWGRYLAGPEDNVNKVLKIFPEPSIQGGSGSMVIFDESGDENEPVYIDYQDWCDIETNMASESKSAEEYATKYEVYLKSIVDWL